MCYNVIHHATYHQYVCSCATQTVADTKRGKGALHEHHRQIEFSTMTQPKKWLRLETKHLKDAKNTMRRTFLVHLNNRTPKV